MKTIVLDAGHGGFDAGAVSASRMEKVDNLNMALDVQKKLQAQGQRVIMTRNTDVFVPLGERAAIANRNNADIFVSIHRNAFTAPTANGIETFTQTGAPAVNARYALLVHNRIINVAAQSNRGLKTGNFQVLRETRAPSMLLELGFITNTRDNQLFDTNFDAYGTAIMRGILEALGEPFYPPTVPPTGDPVIATIQRTLNERYNTNLRVDGIFGAMTLRGLVMGLQTELNRQFNAGLTVDGVFGSRTRSAVRSIRLGARGNEVFILQAALYARGHNPGSLDGVFGINTDTAVRNFQRSRGLTADGIAGPNTFNALLT